MRSHESAPSTHDYALPPRADAHATPLPASDTAAPQPGTRPDLKALGRFPPVLGEYRLLRRAGQGGMGAVFSARHQSSGRTVALKVMQEIANIDPDMRQRFRREVRIADTLRHPHIVPVLDVGEADGWLFFTMPLASTNLDDYRKHFSEPRAAVRLMVAVARAVRHAHAQGIIHRDLKPANILLTAENEPLIADFGLARWLDASQHLTQPGDFLGTPAYMAPEQAAGLIDQIGPPADIWALGVILYELLAGQRPFYADDTRAIPQLVRFAEPPPPRQFRPDLDPALEAVVLKCLRKKPSERYPSATAFADDLERWLDGRPVRAPLLPPTLPGQGRTPERRPRRAAIAVAGLCVGVAALLAFGLGAMPSGNPGAGSRPAAGPGGDDPIPSLANQQWVANKLAAGQPVQLVLPQRGAFRWYRRMFGTDWEFPIKPDPAGRGVQVAHADAGMVVLAPELPSSPYRLEARLSHKDGVNERSTIGLFFGCVTTRVGDAPIVAYLRCTFNDLDDIAGMTRAGMQDAIAQGKIRPQPGWPPLPNGNRIVLDVGLFDKGGNPLSHRVLTGLGWADEFTPAGRKRPGGPAARRLVVDVGPERVAFEFDGRFVGQISRDAINRQLRAAWDWNDLPPEQTPAFAPRGSFGVSVSGSTAVVESFLVTPRVKE